MLDHENPSDLLKVCQITKTYKSQSRFARATQALSGVSLTIPAGSLTGLIGGSGCGKSTFARCITGWEKPDSGDIYYKGRELLHMPPEEFRACRRSLQMVFQDAAMALNPRFSLEEIIAEPLRIAGEKRHRQHERARCLIEEVGMPASWLMRRPAELSGGQRQRIAIARALAADPEFIVFDEAFTGIDLPIQDQLLELLMELRDRLGIALLFISHDLALAGRITDEIAVMQNGRIVEHARPETLLSLARHPYTQSLLAAAPRCLPEANPPSTVDS